MFVVIFTSNISMTAIIIFTRLAVDFPFLSHVTTTAPLKITIALRIISAPNPHSHTHTQTHPSSLLCINESKNFIPVATVKRFTCCPEAEITMAGVNVMKQKSSLGWIEWGRGHTGVPNGPLIAESHLAFKVAGGVY